MNLEVQLVWVFSIFGMFVSFSDQLDRPEKPTPHAWYGRVSTTACLEIQYCAQCPNQVKSSTGSVQGKGPTHIAAKVHRCHNHTNDVEETWNQKQIKKKKKT